MLRAQLGGERGPLPSQCHGLLTILVGQEFAVIIGEFGDIVLPNGLEDRRDVVFHNGPAHHIIRSRNGLTRHKGTSAPDPRHNSPSHGIHPQGFTTLGGRTPFCIVPKRHPHQSCLSQLAGSRYSVEPNGGSTTRCTGTS